MASTTPQASNSTTGQKSTSNIKRKLGFFLRDAVLELQEHQSLKGRWMTSRVLANIINNRYTFTNELEYNTKKLNHALDQHLSLVDGIENNGIVHLKKRLRDGNFQATYHLYAFIQPGDTIPFTPTQQASDEWRQLVEEADDDSAFSIYDAMTRRSKRRRIRTDLDIALQYYIVELNTNTQTSPASLPTPKHFKFESRLHGRQIHYCSISSTAWVQLQSSQQNLLC